jgi:hypothetical protein
MSDQGTEFIPPQDRSPREPKERPLVDMGMGRAGFQVDDPTDPVDLNYHLFSDDREENPEPITDVYIETEDNLYRIRRDNESGTAEMIDANKSRAAKGHLHINTLEEPGELDLVAQVTQPFQFGDVVTGPIIRIFGVNDKPGSTPEERLKELAQGRVSDITTRFKTRVLPPGAEPRSS